MLTDLGCRDKGTCREIGIDTVLGHVRFACSYQTPVPEAKCSRQRKRALEREKAKQRRRKSTNIVRQNEARSAYLLREDLKLNDGMTPGLSAMHNRIAAFSGSFREGAETLQS